MKEMFSKIYNFCVDNFKIIIIIFLLLALIMMFFNMKNFIKTLKINNDVLFYKKFSFESDDKSDEENL